MFAISGSFIKVIDEYDKDTFVEKLIALGSVVSIFVGGILVLAYVFTLIGVFPVKANTEDCKILYEMFKYSSIFFGSSLLALYLLYHD